jgi:hypothetical protein
LLTVNRGHSPEMDFHQYKPFRNIWNISKVFIRTRPPLFIARRRPRTPSKGCTADICNLAGEHAADVNQNLMTLKLSVEKDEPTPAEQSCYIRVLKYQHVVAITHGRGIHNSDAWISTQLRRDRPRGS